MQKFLTGALAAVSTAALSVSTALASPAATLLRTEYERQQQALPLFERDHLIAEPGLLVIAILLAIYLVWKLRRDMRKRDEADRQYREMIAEAERLQAEEDEAKAAAEAMLPWKLPQRPQLRKLPRRLPLKPWSWRRKPKPNWKQPSLRKIRKRPIADPAHKKEPFPMGGLFSFGLRSGCDIGLTAQEENSRPPVPSSGPADPAG